MKEIDEKYILDNVGRMSQREIAAELGVSVSTVNRHCKRLGLSGIKADKPKPSTNVVSVQISKPKRSAPFAVDDLKRLEDLRELLLEEIHESKGSSLARLSKEYRDVLAEIRILQNGDDADGGGFADLISEYQNRMSTTNLASG